MMATQQPETRSFAERAQDAAIEFVLTAEGGFVNNPADPGGATFAGISLRAVVGLKTVDGKLQFDLDGDGDVDVDDIKKLEQLYLSGDTERVVDFYRKRYWDLVKGDELRWPINLATFDAAVNHGPKASIVMLQRSLGVAADGIIGPATIKAVAAHKNVPALLKRFLVERAVLYRQLSNTGRGVFYAGWLRRLFELQAECLRRI